MEAQMPNAKKPKTKKRKRWASFPWQLSRTHRIENERPLFELFRSRAPDFEKPLNVLTKAGVPRFELMQRVLAVAAEYSLVVDARRDIKVGIAALKRKFLRLADSAAVLATKLESANKMVLAHLKPPEPAAAFLQELLALPAQLSLYARTLRHVLQHGSPRRRPPRGQRYPREESLCAGSG